MEQPIVPDARGYVGEAKPAAYCATAIRDSSQEQAAPVEGETRVGQDGTKAVIGRGEVD